MRMDSAVDTPGRVCPVDYHLGEQAFRSGPVLQAEVLYVVGGLYGNTVALDTVLELFESEKTASRLLSSTETFTGSTAMPMSFCALSG